MGETVLLDVLAGKHLSEAIRDYLLTMKEGNPYGFYKLFSQLKPTTSYASVRLYFWILSEIGLIESVRFAPSKRGFKKHLYQIVKGQETDTRWWHPQGELYPDTMLGRAGYAVLKKKGLKPKGGRNRAYIGGPQIAPPPPLVMPPLPAKKLAKLPPKKKETPKKQPITKKMPKTLKLVPKKEQKPEVGTKIILVSKNEIEQKKVEGYKLVKEIDGKYMMEKTA